MPIASVQPPPQPAPKVVQCPSGYLDVSDGKVTTRQTSGDLYAVEYRGTLTNNTSADVFMSRSDPPDVYALADDGEVITIVSRGNFETARTDGTPVPEDFVLKPGQSVWYRLLGGFPRHRPRSGYLVRHPTRGRHDRRMERRRHLPLRLPAATGGLISPTVAPRASSERTVLEAGEP